jgi:hypothetical protein
MKKLLVLVCIFFVAQGLSAQVWTPIITDLLNLESFRHQATYSIEDDLDNAVDGTDIFEVDGARIYTNLSNLVSGTESQGNNATSDRTVALGVTSPVYKGWKVTAFYGNANRNNSFDGIMDETRYQDTDFDEDFNEMYFDHRDSIGKAEESANSIVLNLGKQMSKGAELAFTYKRINYTNREEFEDSAYYIERTLDPTVTVDELWYGAETGSDEYVSPVTTYALSYSKPYRNWTARGDIFLISGGEQYNSEGTSIFFEDRDPGDASTVFTTDDTLTTLDEDKYTANLVGIGLQISDFDKNTGLLWEVGGNFGTVFGSGDHNLENRFHGIYQDEIIASEIQVLDTLSTNNLTAPVSVSGNAMGLTGRIEWQIAENVRFGLGCMLNSMSMTLEEDRAYRLDILSSFDDDDGAGSDYDDYTRTVNGADRDETYTTEMKANRIAIPAGIELNFGKNKDWFMRIGAMAIGAKNETDTSMVTDTINLYQSITIRGDGSRTTATGSSTIDNDYESTDRVTNQDVYYSYGLGWKPSPNLSLDLLGIFDATGVELLSTDWLRSLKLSATINIY